MTVKLSPQKVSRMLAYFFAGMPQTEIARKVGVDQSTISLCVSRFKKRVAEIGLLVAGREYNVFGEVDTLRSLSVELSKNRLTVEEAKQGARIFSAFLKLGVDPEQHADLVRVCGKIGDPSFLDAALKLARIESDSGTSYQEAMSRFEQATSGLPVVEKQLEEKEDEMESAASRVAQKKQELASLKSQLERRQKEVATEEARMKQDLEGRMVKLGVERREVEQVAELKADLGKHGLDIPTMAKLASELGYGARKLQRGDGSRLRQAIEQFGSLHETMKTLEANKSSLERMVAEL